MQRRGPGAGAPGDQRRGHRRHAPASRSHSRRDRRLCRQRHPQRGRHRGGGLQGRREPADRQGRRHPAQRHRQRLPRLQARHLPEAYPAPDAGGPDRSTGCLHRAPARRSVRGAAPVPGPADRGHPVLPRSLGVRAAGAGRDPQAVRGQVSGRSDPAVGARLRYGGRGLLPGHPAARTDLQDGCGAARTDLRHRHRRARPGDRAQRPLPRHHRPAYVARAPRPLVREGRRHLQHRQGSARDVHLLAAQPDQGRPVFPHRPAVVPQPPDLPEQRASGAGDPDLPLLAAARRLPVPGSGGKRHPAPEAVRADRSPQPDFPAAGDAHAGAAGLPSEPADGSSGRRRRGRLPSAATGR